MEIPLPIHPEAVEGATRMLALFFHQNLGMNDSEKFIEKLLEAKKYWAIGRSRMVSILNYEPTAITSRDLFQKNYLISVFSCNQVPVFKPDFDQIVLTLALELHFLDSEYGLQWIGSHLVSGRTSTKGRVNVGTALGYQRRDKTIKLALSDVIFVLLREPERLAKECK